MMALRFSSDSGLRSLWSVLPKAAAFAFESPRFAISSKNSLSLGFDPGHPPSM
jgi:hypothetical protein